MSALIWSAHGQDDRLPGFSGTTKARDPRPARKMVGWLASLALYKCRAFGLRFLLATYFRLAGGTNPTGPSVTGIYQES